jgi:hypothetical protein
MRLKLRSLKKTPNKGFGISILCDLAQTLKIQIAELEPLRYNFAPLTDSQLPAMGFAIIFTK